jgi:predicted exporter
MPRQRPIEPEEPRCEPEIIPPARGRTQAYQAGPDWFAGNGRGTSRIFVARLGPWSLIGIVLLIGLFAGAVLAILLGALLIAIPVVGLLVAGALIANALRARLRR